MESRNDMVHKEQRHSVGGNHSKSLNFKEKTKRMQKRGKKLQQLQVTLAELEQQEWEIAQ